MDHGGSPLGIHPCRHRGDAERWGNQSGCAGLGGREAIALKTEDGEPVGGVGYEVGRQLQAQARVLFEAE